MEESLDVVLQPEDNGRLANLCGQYNQHLQQIEQRLCVKISNRGYVFKLIGGVKAVQQACAVLKDLYQLCLVETLTPERLNLYLQAAHTEALAMQPESAESLVIKTKRGLIKVHGPNQNDYVTNIRTHDLVFGIGPAGTGKTYLAVACAVEALEADRVRRLVLVRPAVEAGERLGFLPGDMAQKVDPYLRPIYDALYEMLGFEKVVKLMERHVIEVAPLAYMRGRTLNDAFIILDEAQNTTPEQMKMFLTRIGFGSTTVVTGDITQVDLPVERKSGLREVAAILQHVNGVHFTHFTVADVVRHPLVQKIVNAYEQYENGRGGGHR